MNTLKDPTHAFMVGPKVLETGGAGPLANTTFAVKDLFDVNHLKTGAGNPDWLADAKESEQHAPCIERLINAGATLIGKTITDELAFSLSGTNVHYGTPINPIAKEMIPGGSSSGSASAVAAGSVTFALGTDTAGSTRVPASYCGIWGFRPSVGRITTKGMVPLAPSFDTVGIFTRSGAMLQSVFNAIKDPNNKSQERPIDHVIAPLDLFSLVDLDVDNCLRDAVRRITRTLYLSLSWDNVLDIKQLKLCQSAFRRQQLAEAWQSHGMWIKKRKPTLGLGIAARFELASRTEAPSEFESTQIRHQIMSTLKKALIPGGILILPVTPNTAPSLTMSGDEKEALRQSLFSLNSLASFLGAPELVVPVECSTGTIGLGIMALPGEDEILTAIAEALDNSRKMELVNANDPRVVPQL